MHVNRMQEDNTDWRRAGWTSAEGELRGRKQTDERLLSLDRARDCARALFARAIAPSLLIFQGRRSLN